MLNSAIYKLLYCSSCTYIFYIYPYILSISFVSVTFAPVTTMTIVTCIYTYPPAITNMS